MSAKEIFERFDKNKDGKLSFDEFREAVLALSNTFTDEEIVMLFEEIDVDGDGGLDVNEFTSSITKMLKKMFDTCDVDGDGKITPNEFYATIGPLDNECTEEKCAAMFRASDKDGDGFLSFEEFMAMTIGAFLEK